MFENVNMFLGSNKNSSFFVDCSPFSETKIPATLEMNFSGFFAVSDITPVKRKNENSADAEKFEF